MRKLVPAVIVGSLACAMPALAKEIKFPDGNPQVSIQIPDDWKLEFSDAGLAASAPENNSFVYVQVLKRPKDDPNAWLKAACAKLEAQGVTFATGKAATMNPASDSGAKAPDAKDAPATKAEAKPSQETKVTSDGKPAQAAPDAKPLQETKAASDAKPLQENKAAPDAKVPPDAKAATDLKNAQASVEAPAAKPAEQTSSPEKKAANDAAKDQKPPQFVEDPISREVPSFALLGTKAPPVKLTHFPRHALPYKDTLLDGKPVDVELLTYNLPDQSMFFLLQESGPTDTRVVDIVNSVKPAK